ALLKRLGQRLKEVAQAEGGVCVGRLNGGDFAVALRGVEVAQLAASAQFVAAWREVLQADGVAATFVLGGVTWWHGLSTAQVLAAADASLARAEATGPFAVEIVHMDDSS